MADEIKNCSIKSENGGAFWIFVVWMKKLSLSGAKSQGMKHVIPDLLEQ